MRYPLRMYSERGGWMHVYNPPEQAQLERIGWVVDDPEQGLPRAGSEPAKVEAVQQIAEVSQPIPIRRGPGRPRKAQPDAIPQPVDIDDDAIDAAQEM